MTQPPDWWESLIADPVTQRLGIDWHAPSDWKPVDDEAWTGTMSNELLDSMDAQQRAGKVLVGSGPAVSRRAMGHDSKVNWFLDPEQPQQLWCALGEFYAAWLWVPIAPTASAVAEVLSASHPRPELTRLDLTSFTRGFLGFRDEVLVPHVYSGDMVELNGHDLDRYFTGVEYVEQSSWASAKLDDPMRDEVESVSPVVMLAASKQNNSNTQLLGRIPSMTWRTAHSRSYLSFEIHSRAVVCASVRYRPAPASHQDVVKRLNDEYNADFPTDLPLDVIGALSGFNFARETGLIHNLTEPEDMDQLAAGIRIFAALWCGDLKQTARLREFAGHEEPTVRLAVAQAASWYGYRFLLEEIALAETEPDMIAALENLVIQGSDPDTFNAFGDHFHEQPVMIDRNGDAVHTWTHDPGDDEPEDEAEFAEDERDD
jgi:hypothetical protein